MPLEIAFQGDRESLLKAINAITESKDYLFTINSLRVRNERMMPPPITSEKPATTQAQPATDSLKPADELAKASAVPTIQQIIKPYMGKEQVFVQISLNLVHFTQPKAPSTSED